MADDEFDLDIRVMTQSQEAQDTPFTSGICTVHTYCGSCNNTCGSTCNCGPTDSCGHGQTCADSCDGTCFC